VIGFHVVSSPPRRDAGTNITGALPIGVRILIGAAERQEYTNPGPSLFIGSGAPHAEQCRSQERLQIYGRVRAMLLIQHLSFNCGSEAAHFYTSEFVQSYLSTRNSQGTKAAN
jgi:hypothetical protein